MHRKAITHHIMPPIAALLVVMITLFMLLMLLMLLMLFIIIMLFKFVLLELLRLPACSCRNDST